MALVLDTGVVLALLNAKDRYHRACVELAMGTREPLVIPAAILGEVDGCDRAHIGQSSVAAASEERL